MFILFFWEQHDIKKNLIFIPILVLLRFEIDILIILKIRTYKNVDFHINYNVLK